MTREEAKKILTEIWSLTEKQMEAVNVAIEALEQTERKTDIRMSRCSKCGYKLKTTLLLPSLGLSSRCPICGAKIAAK